MPEYPPEIELALNGIAQGGDGVGRWQGQVVFARGGLPGEKVRVRLHERKPRYVRGRVVEVLTAAPERIAPRLPEADHIPWQHIDYAAQVRLKQTILREQFARLGQLADIPLASAQPAPAIWGYRNTAHLHVRQSQIGYYAADSRTLRDLPHDPLLLPALNEALAGLRDLLLISPVDTLYGVTLRGSAAYGYAAALLHSSQKLPALAWCWQAGVPTLAAAAQLPDSATLHEELGGLVFVLSLDSFFQTYTAQAETLLAVVRALLALQPHECLLDAYSGVGTFALPLAGAVRQVIAIEENSQAVRDGAASARLNAIDNVTFMNAAVERALPTCDTPIDAAILDPPRRGCHPAALEALVQREPLRIAYVSCHPGILVRDVQRLRHYGYHLHHLQLVDMFPQTPHIECVALLTRTPPAR